MRKTNTRSIIETGMLCIAFLGFGLIIKHTKETAGVSVSCTPRFATLISHDGGCVYRATTTENQSGILISITEVFGNNCDAVGKTIQFDTVNK